MNVSRVSGISIVEMVVSIAMATFAIVAIGSFTISFYRTNAYGIEQSFAIHSARKGIDLMVRDIREATYSDEGSFPVVSIAPYAMVVYSDVDRDDSVERISFSLEGTNLIRGKAESAGDPPVYPGENDEEYSVSDSVRNETYGTPIFQYYDESGNEITDYDAVTDVVFVTVNVLVNINPSRLPRDFSLRSSASLRNTRVGTE